MRLVRKSYRNKGSKENIVISIAGPHGVGKSTIFRLLKKKVADSNKFKFFPERYIKNPPFPFGSRNKDTAFRSELHFLQQLIKRNKSVRNYDNRYNGRIILLDRTPLCVLVYSKALFLKEKDFQLIEKHFSSIKWREDYILYLTADIETILTRIYKRGSLETIRRKWNEDDKNYLSNVLSFYEQIFEEYNQNEKVIRLNTDNLEPYEVLEKIKIIIEELSEYSFTQHLKPPPKQMRLDKFI
jgi:deoxyadenosine/deoxycytidine kinase